MNCRGCGYVVELVVFEMDPMPLAGGFTKTREEALQAERLPLTWVQCTECKLVQVAEDVPDDILYENYSYASSSVGALCDHFDKYAEFLTIYLSDERPRRVLEIGCNDGILLRRLPKDWELIGVDPSDVALVAPTVWAGHEGASYHLINEPFTGKLGLRDFDLVFASNCLAHITDIRGTVEAAAQALRPEGEFWVEVHDLNATLQTGQWDTIYHEHKVEYSLATLVKTVEPHGFRLRMTTKLPLHGGLIRAGFVKTEEVSTIPFPDPTYSFDLLNEAYKNRRVSEEYRKFFDASVAYGASGRATVWFNQFPELEFQAVIDDSPLRQGKFVPGVGWPIVSWSDRPKGDCILITAWNYADQIRNQRSDYNGQWLQTWKGR